jgi:putative membrane-bound dehydrogenase-like protein
MVVNPTNMDIDAKGRVWVCEGINYRPRLNVGNDTIPKGDKIVILEDTDGDGKADLSKTFYQGTDINTALGVAVFGNRVIVSASPNMYIFTDEDGDDKADKKEVLFTGIGGNQNDHGLHAVTFGPDGKFYFNFGNAGKQIKDKNGNDIKDTQGNTINNTGKPYRQGMLFRCNTDGTQLEVLGNNFRNIYEPAVDSYGAVWQTDNDDDGNKGVRVNYIIEKGNYGYTDEITGAGWKTIRTGMHEEIPKRHWYQNSPGVIPNLLYTGAGSPAGLTIYEGKLLPEIFQGEMIHADAGPNVVRAYPVKKEGAGFTASIQNIFKSTSDSWFRPIDVTIAPDGSLFIADWYDPGVGGHQAGDQQQGRIFRIAPSNTPYKFNNLDVSTTETAVTALKSPNIATRYIAWQALHNWGIEAEPALKQLLDTDTPWEKARALWLLANIEGKAKEYIDLALSDKNEDIRLTGLRIARSINYQDLASIISKAIQDESDALKREAAVSLTYLPADQIPALWAQIATQYKSNDRWMLEALGVAADKNPDACYTAWMQQNDNNWNTPAGQEIIWRVRSKNVLPHVAELISHPAASQAMLDKYFRALDFHEEAPKDELLVKIAEIDHPQKDHIQTLVVDHISAGALLKSSSLKTILDQVLTANMGNMKYINWVKKYNLSDQKSNLTAIMLNEPNSEVGIEASRLLKNQYGLGFFTELLKIQDETVIANTMTAMTQLGDDESWEFMKKITFDEAKPINVRKKAVIALGTGWVAEDRLLAMLQENEIPEPLVTTAANTLLSAYKGSVRKVAAQYLDSNGNDEMPDLNKLMAMEGDALKGKVVFEKLCSTCHQVDGIGISFGPDLSEIGNKLSKDGLYAAVIYPDAGINFGYEGYVANMKDGSRIVGYITSKTEHELQVRQMGGTTATIDRAQVQNLEALENSLMTSGLYRTMNDNEFTNLISYLQSLKGSKALATLK